MAEFSEIIRDLHDERDSAQQQAVGWLDSSPDDAARSLELSEATGVPAGVINADLPSFERQHKASLAGNIVKNNSYIADYINSHPLAAQVSNDDYGNLDEVSQKVGQIPIVSAPSAIGAAAVSGFKKGFDPSAPLGQWLMPALEKGETGRLGYAMWSTLGAAIEVPARAFSGALGGIEAGIKEAVLQFGGSEQNAASLAREVAGLAEYHMMNPTHELHTGAHPVIDAIKAEQNEIGVKALEDSFKASESSLTKERNPEMFANFIRQHSDAEIGVSADAVRKLYGEKVPEPDDGILGFIPGLQEKLTAAEAVGGDVQIPIADWLAKVEPEVAKALRDDTRIRPGGITATEMKGIADRAKASIDVYHGSPHEFDAFSMEKIGTGEGAQSYGHGLYFAENPGVADSYKTAGGAETGNQYRVRINADKEQFLDWDKPLSGQTPHVQERVRDFIQQSLENQQKAKEGALARSSDLVDSPRRQAYIDKLREPMADINSLTGAEIYKRFGLPAMDQYAGTKKASAALREAGIPGIKYLDQGSRGKAEGTHNFVLFDESLAQILDRNGQAVESVRKAAALDPIRSKERKVVLKRIDENLPGEMLGQGLIRGVKGEPLHQFEIADPDGTRVGSLYVAEENGGKRLYIDDIEGINRDTAANSLGPAAMRDLLRQLKAEFPKAEELSGFRVSGARDKANSWEEKGKVSIKLSAPDAAERFIQAMRADRMDEFGTEHEVATGFTATSVPEDKLLGADRKIVDSVNAEIEKLKAFDVDVEPVHKIEGPDGEQGIRGLYLSFENARPSILYSLNAEDPVGVFRHEVIHDLRERGFFTDEEWGTLEKAAKEGDWLKKHDIENRYPDKDLTAEGRLEEAIADEFADWKRSGEPKTGFAKAFEKLKEFFEAIKRGLKQALGKDLTDQELFQLVEKGDIYSRDPTKEGTSVKQAREFQPELPGTRRMEDREPFAPGAIMTKEQGKRYQRLIELQQLEDFQAAAKRAMEEQRKKQSAEWKNNFAETRLKVADEINARPDVQADKFFADGTLYGEKVPEPPKLRADALTDAQKASLPKDYIAKNGMHPDDVAPLFGYQSGEAMINHLALFNGQREASGMRPMDYSRRLIDAETERQMEAKYGKLGDVILDEAKEQVLSETQLNLLHEETLALALKTKGEFTITKEDFKAMAEDEFNGLDAKDISSDNFIADAGRAGRAVEDAMLRQDWAKAYREKQRQYKAVLYTKFARDFEKAKGAFEKTAARYSSREVGGASQEYTDAIHSMMVTLGLPVKRSLQDITEGMRKAGFSNFGEFVSQKESGLRDLHVPEWILEGGKKLDDLSVQESKELFKAMKALTFNARDELKLIKAGEKFDLDQTIDEMVEKIKSLGEPRKYPIDRKESIKEYGKSWWWSGINVESMLNRLDRDRATGIFNQFVIRHFTEASNYKDKLIRDFQGKIAEVGKIPDMDKVVENTLFVDPITGERFKMRRRNVLGILQNVGNESNLAKLAKGYNIEPAELMQWLEKNTTKEDWDRAQKIGDTFKEIYKLADNMSHNVSGVGIESLPLKQLQSAYGTYEGWYNPVKYDSLRPGESKKLLGPNALEQEGFYRATTPQGYTKGRTGYAAPMELNLDIVPIRMKQMIHDIAMRPAVLQLSKVFYNPKFERAMIGYFGKHQAKEMIPFLHDIANSANFKSMSAGYGDSALEFFRQNTIATLIGFNPGTVMKHGATAAFNSLTEVGAANFAREFTSLLSDTPEGNTNWRMAMEKSEELQRRMRNYSELISGHGSEINIKGARSKFASYRDFMMQAGATPVSISDLLSAVPTFLARYKDSISKGADEGQAVFEADRAVRHAHGSSVLSNRPSISRTNALGSWFSSLYGFFSHMQQKQYELAWKAKDLVKDTIGKGSGDLESAKRHAPDLLKGFMSYVVLPAIIEEMVTPYTNSDKDSWGAKAVKTMALGVGSSLIGVRDFVNSLVNVREPQAGLAATTMKFAQDLPKDLLSKQPMSKERAASVLHHTFSTVGIFTGLTNNTEGSIAQYLYRYNHGLEHPKGPVDIFSGLRHGKTKH